MIKNILILMLITSNFLLGSVAIVKKITGRVDVTREGITTPIKVGNSLKNGDLIITKSKSSIGIIFDDGSLLSLGSKAIFTINSFIVKPSIKEYDVDLELKKGKAMFSSGKIGKLSPESFTFRIPEGAIGIRGTKFLVEVK